MNKQKVFRAYLIALALVLIGTPLAAGRSAAARQGGEFIVEDGEVLTAVLNRNLSTERGRDGERFTMYVTAPGRYRGATIYGYVSGSQRAGRIKGRSELTLNFDRIRLRNGRRYKFAGTIETVRTKEGEKVEVSTEGEVKEGNDQTDRTVGRTVVGSGVGALIGAIAGGGKGAAIGAAIGGGIGVGSVLVQGGDALKLERGTRMTIRAGAPGR